jgi:hypothetical protein
MRARDPDAICGLCDEFDVDQVAPEPAGPGTCRCLARDEGCHLALHVEWSDGACVSFRLDRTNLRRRRQFVSVQRRALETDQ